MEREMTEDYARPKDAGKCDALDEHVEQSTGCFTISVCVEIGDMLHEVETFISRKKWEDYLPIVVNEVQEAIEMQESDEADFVDMYSYMGTDGYWKDCETPQQTFVAYHLQSAEVSMAEILGRCDALSTFKAALLENLEGQEGLSVVEDTKNLKSGCDQEEEDVTEEQEMFINDIYPPVLLEEIYARLTKEDRNPGVS